MVSYSSLLSAPGTQQCPGATAFYNNTLYYIGNGHDPAIYVLSRRCDANSLDPSENPDKEGDYWSQKKLQDEPNFQNFQDGCGTGVPPACAVAGDYLYFVWIQRKGVHNLQVWATRLGSGGSKGSKMEWSQPVRLCAADGSALSIAGSNLSVTAWGDYLIACYKGEKAVFLLVYDTSDWPSQGGPGPSSWKASGGWSHDLGAWHGFPHFSDLGDQISMDWFTPGGAKPGTASAAPAIYLIISFFNAGKKETYIWHVMDVTPLDQWTGGQPFKKGQVEHRGSTDFGVNVIRDPAGRMRAYSCDPTSNNAIWYITLATNDVASDGYSWTKFSPDWTVLYGSAGRQLSDQGPVPAFVMGPSTTEGKKTVRQVYEFVLFHQHNHIRLVFSHFGEAKLIRDAHTLNLNEQCLKPNEKPELVLTGLVDSPLPMPTANLAGPSSTKVEGESSTSSPQGYVQYGTTESKGDTRKTSWSWSAGFISKGYATAGVTPAWQISFNAGMAGATGSTDTTQDATTDTANTSADQKGPQGTYFHGGIIFHRDEYLFYDVNLDGTTNKKPMSNAPTITSIWTTYTGIAANALQSYANEAGNLWSYTKAGWNARMQQLGYPSDNYFDEVITAQDKDGKYVNAVVLGASGSPFLEFAWSTTGSVSQKVHAVSTTFEESGWHMEASVYVGYSFDIGAEVFGFGEEQFGELLFGGSYSRSTENETKDGKSWGISVDYNLPNPPSLPYPGQVTAVSWRLYLLKANKQWTNELIAYGDPEFKDQIDPNSAPWRIVFEVDEDTVLFQGDNRNLVYRDQSGQIIEAWYYPGGQYNYASVQQAQEGFWSWTNLTQEAKASDGSTGRAPNAASEPCWFAWGMSEPSHTPYKQAVVFRAADGDVYFLWSDSYGTPVETGDGQKRPKIKWTWRNLAQTQGFVKAAGDPVGYHWETNPWGASISVIYRGVDGDLHELYLPADQVNKGEWKTVNVTKSLPEQEKPASDPCALVWNEDPGGPSEHIYYRTNNNQIYEYYYDRGTKKGWKLTKVSALSHDHATPTGKPGAFAWDGGGAPSLHVGYRGSTGQIHELRREHNNWQPANDLSSDAHATAADQLAAEGPICGIAWERRAALQTIHWYYLTSTGEVCELWRGAGDATNWRWHNLSEKATVTKHGSGKLPAVAAIVQGQVWYFDPATGSSIDLYLRAQDGALYELRYLPTGPTSESGVWQWTELTGWVTDAAGNPLPNAASGSG